MAVLFILLTTIVVVLWFLCRQRSTLPRPPGCPVFGNLFQFIRPRVDLYLTEWSHKLGPVFRVRLLHMNLVIVNDYDSIHTVLVKQGKEFSGRSAWFLKRLMYAVKFNAGISVSAPTRDWKVLRQIVLRNVKMYDQLLRRDERANMAAIENMVRELCRRGGDGSPLDPYELVKNTAFNFISGFLLGRRFSQDDPFFLLAVEVERESVAMFLPGSRGTELEVMWSLRHLSRKNFQSVQRLADKARELWVMARRMVEEDLEESGPHTGPDRGPNTSPVKGGVLHDLVASLRAHDDDTECINEENVHAVFIDLVIAGMTTTAHMFYFFLNIMACYPEVQDRLRREVDDVVGAERAVSLDDRQSMPYTRATVIELTRYTLVSSLGIPHCTLSDTSINGHQFPKDSIVLVNFWAMHHDEKFWGDPWEFRPERFLDDQGELLAADHERRRHVMPFGAGPRMCLGETIALSRLFMLVATVVQRFELLPGPNPVSCDQREYKLFEALRAREYELRFIPRQKLA